MTPEIVWYVICGMSAGLLGGYLGLGGGEVIVPFLTIILGVEVKTAVPVSVLAVVVNALSSSTEYLRRGMVDFELTVILAIFMVMGNITGSTLSLVVSEELVRMLLTGLLIYTAFTLLKGRQDASGLVFVDNRRHYMGIVNVLAFFIGTLSGLIGVGGGVMLLPLIYLVVGCPLATARGTSAFIVVFSAAAASAVYLLRGDVSLAIAAPVIFGILVGGRLGGFLGTMAKPVVIRVLFFVVMLYLAWRLAAGMLENLL